MKQKKLYLTRCVLTMKEKTSEIVQNERFNKLVWYIQIKEDEDAETMFSRF